MEPLKNKTVRIAFLSDIHSYFYDLTIEEVDILCITGDIFEENSEDELTTFMSWLQFRVKAEDIIIVPGNHDRILTIPYYCNKARAMDSRVRIMKHKGKQFICEGIRFSAFEYCELHNWAFYLPDDIMMTEASKIPECDILLTHMPPLGILDVGGINNQQLGNSHIKNNLQYIMPAIHAFGHIHEGYGVKKVNEITYINSSYAGDDRRSPIIVDYEVETRKVTFVNYYN